MKIQIFNSSAKIYKAQDNQLDPSKSVKFKFFTNYMLVDNQKLKIFDFSEFVIFQKDYCKFIITRINDFMGQMEIHVAGCEEIKKKLGSIDFQDQSLLEIKSNMKESLDLKKQQKIVSVNIKEDFFIIVMTDQLLIYSLFSLIGISSEKVIPLKVILYNPILLSIKPFISSYFDDKIYLFQKNISYKSKKNQLIVNYKVIDCKSSEKPQLNQRITFQSPQVAQSTETMLSYIEKVKMNNQNQLHLTVYTIFQNQAYKQKIISEQGETRMIKKQKQYFNKSDLRDIESVSNKDDKNKLI